MLAGDLVHHQPEEGEAVRHRQGIGVLKIGLELPRRVLLVEGEHVPAEPVHRLDDLLHHRKAGQHRADVIGRLVQRLGRPDRRETAVIRLLEQEKFRFDAEIEDEAHLRRLLDRALEDVARACFERLAVQPQIAGEPGGIAFPGQHHRRARVGNGGHLVVIDLLRNAIEGSAGEQLGAVQHAVEMLDRHHLAFRSPVNVGVAGKGVADALRPEALLQVHRRT